MGSELIKNFCALEEELDLFKKKHKGVEVWPLIREKVYFKIEAKSKSYSKRTVADKNLRFFQLFTNFVSVVLNTVRYLVSKKDKASLLFITHPRRKNDRGKYIDIYTDPVGSLLNFSHQSLEPMFQLKHFRPPVTKNLLYLDAIEFWSRLFSFFTQKSLSDQEKLFWLKIEEEIEQRFGVNNVEVIKLIELEAARYQLAKPKLKKLIKAIEPSLILEVVSYQRINKVINVIAKELDIPTAELQHGYIGRRHIAYNFPDNTEVNSFPDYLLVWGDYWKKNIQLPIEDSNIITTGFEYFNQKNKQSTKDSKKQFLFISQGTIGPKLAESALELSKMKKFSGYDILYKLHPSEFSDSRNRYSDLYNSDRIHVIDSDSDADLYQLILNSSAIIGVYSTALIEAVGLRKKVFVLKITGWEALEEFVEERTLNIELLDGISSLKEIGPYQTVKEELNSHFLFAPTDFSLINEIIQSKEY